MATPQGISNQIIIRVVLGKGTLGQRRRGISKVRHRGESRLTLIGKCPRTSLVNSRVLQWVPNTHPYPWVNGWVMGMGLDAWVGNGWVQGTRAKILCNFL